jgi:hypothetical protein
MNSKVLIGGVIGGVAFFLLGYLLYGLLMADMLANCTSCQKPMAEINFVVLAVGNLFIGWGIAYILSKWAGASSFNTGATAGAVIGLLLGIGFDCTAYATNNMFTGTTCILYDVIIIVVMWAITGGLIGWWMGRK